MITVVLNNMWRRGIGVEIVGGELVGEVEKGVGGVLETEGSDCKCVRCKYACVHMCAYII